MNFKDSYKSAVDEIHGDRALLHSILNGEVQKKKFSFNFKPVYSVALAAMFVVTATSLYFKTGIEDHTITKETARISTSDDASKSDDITTAPQNEAMAENADLTPASDVPANTESEFAASISAKTAETAPPVKAKSQPATEKNQPDKDATPTAQKDKSGLYDSLPDTASVKPESSKAETSKAQNEASSHYTEETDKSRVAEAFDEPAVDMAVAPSVANADDFGMRAYNDEVMSDAETDAYIPSANGKGGASGGGGGGSSAARASGGGSASSQSSAVLKQTISLADYWLYLGANPVYKIALPEGMHLNLPQSVTLTQSNGKTTSDIITVSAVSDDGSKSFSLAISKVSDLGTLWPGATQFANGNIKYAITAKNLNNEEISAIINSLK